MSAELEAGSGARDREWWLRTLVVTQAPGPVFVALRDNSVEAADARQEPIALVAFAVGIALTAVTSTAATFADDPARGGIVIPVWLLIAGMLVGIVNYWLGGAVLYLALRAFGATGTFRQARHLLGLAQTPLVLGLVLLLVRLAVYGGAIFHEGGRDSGAGGTVLRWAIVPLALWALALLAFGIRTVYRWSWPRALAALAVAALAAGLLDVGLTRL